jgi:hypothetical protein
VDHIFREENDGVVPTRGSYEAASHSPGFPIPPQRLRVYQLEDQIHHNNFFVHEVVNQQIQQWLIT